MLTTHQAAKKLGVSDATLRRYYQKGALRPLRLPTGVYRIPHEEFSRFLQACAERQNGEVRCGGAEART